MSPLRLNKLLPLINRLSCECVPHFFTLLSYDLESVHEIHRKNIHSLVLRITMCENETERENEQLM